MHIRKNALVIVAVAAFVAAGCHGPQRTTPRVVSNEQTISVLELASRLGLRLDEQNGGFVILKNENDTVLVFIHADGRFFVNGQPVGPVGPVKKVAGTVYVSDALVARIRPHLGTGGSVLPQIPTAPRAGRLVIDPGHGGRDPGAIGVTGVYEKTINLAVAKKIAADLRRKGLTVTMTREDDRYPELESRADIANRRHVNLFVSIHCDSAPNTGAQGFTLYVANAASSDALRAARAIAKSMATTDLDNRGIRREDYRVLVQTECPAVLIELGYISNVQDSAKLENNAFQNRLAAAVAAGIADYFR